jgi:hypothetical protein
MHGKSVHGGAVDQGEIFRGSDVSGQDPVEAGPEVDSFLLNVRKGLEKIEKCFGGNDLKKILLHRIYALRDICMYMSR